MVTNDCGHLFCAACITKAMKTKKECPVCRKTLRTVGTSLHKDLRAQRRIAALNTPCPHVDDGCAWGGTLGELDEHLKTCQMVEVPCTYAHRGCKALVKRKNVKKHEKDAMGDHLELVEKLLIKKDKAIDKQEACNNTKDSTINNLRYRLGIYGHTPHY